MHSTKNNQRSESLRFCAAEELQHRTLDWKNYVRRRIHNHSCERILRHASLREVIVAAAGVPAIPENLRQDEKIDTVHIQSSGLRNFVLPTYTRQPEPIFQRFSKYDETVVAVGDDASPDDESMQLLHAV